MTNLYSVGDHVTYEWNGDHYFGVIEHYLQDGDTVPVSPDDYLDVILRPGDVIIRLDDGGASVVEQSALALNLSADVLPHLEQSIAVAQIAEDVVYGLVEDGAAIPGLNTMLIEATRYRQAAEDTKDRYLDARQDIAEALLTGDATFDENGFGKIDGGFNGGEIQPGYSG
jgi:hypothetical protein